MIEPSKELGGSTAAATGPEAPTERELKLTPPAGFELSTLERVLPGWTIRALPSLDLVATYFDTDTLTLARAGITIRHRLGDGARRGRSSFPPAIARIAWFAGSSTSRAIAAIGPRSWRRRSRLI